MNHELATETLEWGDDEERTSRSSQRARVLVVEDDPALRELVVSRLVDDGYAVDEAETGSAALRKLHSLHLDAFPDEGVDLILLDQRMPGMHGLEVLRKLRASHRTTPAILMTAFPEPPLLAEAAALGVCVLAKPFPLDDLSCLALTTLLAAIRKGERCDDDVAS